MSDILKADDIVTPARSTFSVRHWLATIHLWLGVIFALPFIALGLSGSILMIDHEIPSLSGAQSTPPAITKPIAEIIAAAQNAAPFGASPTAVMAPQDAGGPMTVRFSTSGNSASSAAPRPNAGAQVLVDPDTLSATLAPPRTGDGGFMRLMHDLHGRLLISGIMGRQIVGWLGVFMCVLGLSGLVMWWPRGRSWKAWKAALTFKFGKSALKTNRDMHGAVGIWGLVVFMIVSASGAYLGFPQQISGFFDAAPMVRDQRGVQLPKVTPLENETALSADDVVALAKNDVPDGTLWSVMYPAKPDAPYRVNLTRVVDDKPVRVAVFVDAWAKRIMEVRDPSALTGIDKVLVMQRGLHVGTGHGFVWWLLVFLSGLLPLLFTVTGISMWLMKRRAKRRMNTP